MGGRPSAGAALEEGREVAVLDTGRGTELGSHIAPGGRARGAPLDDRGGGVITA